MNKSSNSTIGHNKSSFLDKAIEHIDITSFDARPIIDAMAKMSFTSRETANAAQIYNEMLNDKVDIINKAINHLEKLVLMANLMK
ncbi:MAG: hypothetical protein RI930_741 [Pseudomonadota bacterium]